LRRWTFSAGDLRCIGYHASPVKIICCSLWLTEDFETQWTLDGVQWTSCWSSSASTRLINWMHTNHTCTRRNSLQAQNRMDWSFKNFPTRKRRYLIFWLHQFLNLLMVWRLHWTTAGSSAHERDIHRPASQQCHSNDRSYTRPDMSICATRLTLTGLRALGFVFAGEMTEAFTTPLNRLCAWKSTGSYTDLRYKFIKFYTYKYKKNTSKQTPRVSCVPARSVTTAEASIRHLFFLAVLLRNPHSDLGAHRTAAAFPFHWWWKSDLANSASYTSLGVTVCPSRIPVV